MSAVRTSASGHEGNWTPPCSFPRQITQCRRDAGDPKPARCRRGRVLERLRQPAGAPQAAVRPRRARRTEWGGRPVACRPTRPGGLEVVLPTEVPRGGCGDTAIHQDELEPAGDALLGRVLQHQVAGPVLVGRGRNHQRGHRKAGDVDGHDTLRALRAAVGDASPGRPHRKAPDRPSGRGPAWTRQEHVVRPWGRPRRWPASPGRPRCRLAGSRRGSGSCWCRSSW